MALNEKQNEYLVKKISKYEKEINYDKKKIVVSIIAFAILILNAINCMGPSICENITLYGVGASDKVNDISNLITKILALGNAIGATMSLKVLISSIAEKVGLERRIDEIQDQFALDKLEDKERVK